jgi:phosphonate transport system substrate-binding protein
MKHVFQTVIFFCICQICLCTASAFAEEYTLSILPRYFPEKLTAMMTPLAQYLGKETGKEIKPILMANFAEYADEAKKHAITIGYENPLVYVNISSAHEVIATAVKGAGGDKFRGIIITRPDSPIKKPSDLKGKKVMIVGKTSAGGYLSQKLTLKEMGIDVDHDCELSTAADNRQENVIISVSIGDVDAGFIRESALHKADQFIMPGSIVTIAETAWLPNWALSVDRNLPDTIKSTIQKSVLKLPRDSDILKAMGLVSFIAATDADYDIMRSIIK